VQVLGDREHVLGGTAQPVQLPHGEGVALPHVVESSEQPDTVGVLVGRLVLEDAGAPCLSESVRLKQDLKFGCTVSYLTLHQLHLCGFA
jgi:hypothetical protein